MSLLINLRLVLGGLIGGDSFAISKEGMVLWLKNLILPRNQWDDADTQLNDYSNSNNGGQIHSGGALSFTTNDYAEGGADYDGASTTELTVFTKVNISGSRTDSFCSIGDTGANTRRWTIRQNGRAFQFNISADGGSTNLKAWIDDDELAQDGAHEIGFTFDSGTFKLYHNGTEITSIDKVIDGTVNSLFTTSDPLLIGAELNSGIESRFLTGDVQEFRAYSRALSASEVLQNYNNPQQPITNGLEVWYDFNELNGFTLFDRSGNGNNASILGATWESGVKEGFQPALGGFNNYEVFDGVDDKVVFTTFDFASSTIKFGFIYTSGEQQIIDWSDASSYSLAVTLNSTVTFNNDFVVNADNSNNPQSGAGWAYNGLNEGDYYEVILNVDASNQITSGTINGNDLISTSGKSRFAAASQLALGIRFDGSFPYSGIFDYIEVEGDFRASNLGGWVDEIGANDGTVNGSPTTARIAGPTYDAKYDVFENPFSFNELDRFDGTSDSIRFTRLTETVGASDEIIVSGIIDKGSIGDGTRLCFLGDRTTPETTASQFYIRNITAAELVIRDSAQTVTFNSPQIKRNQIFEVRLVFNSTTIDAYLNGALIGTESYSGTMEIFYDNIGGERAQFKSGFWLGTPNVIEIKNRHRWSNALGWKDSIGSNDGTINGSPVQVRYPALTYNEYFKFDGVNDYVSLANNVFSGMTSIVVNSKFNITAGAIGGLIDERDSGSDGFGVSVNGSNQVLVSLNSTVVTSAGTVPLNEPTEISVNWNGANVVFTIDGVSEAPQVLTGVIDTTATANIGTDYNTSPFVNGIIDYVEVEGVGRWENLTNWVDQIGSNNGTVNGSPAIVREFGSPTQFNVDDFGNTIAGALTTDEFGNSLLKTTGFIPNALNFSGGYTGLYVDAGANVDTATDFSYAGWHYLDGGSSTFDILYANRTNGLGQELAALDVVTGSTYELRFRNDDGSNNDVTTTTDLNYGTWHFVAACYTTAGAVNIYVGTKDTAPTRYGNGNFSAPAAGSLNMAFTNRPDGSVSFGGYELYEIMYNEDLSSANTDLTKINQIYEATKGLVPNNN